MVVLSKVTPRSDLFSISNKVASLVGTDGQFLCVVDTTRRSIILADLKFQSKILKCIDDARVITTVEHRVFKSVPRLVRPWLWPLRASSTEILTRRISGEALIIIECKKWSGKPIGIFHLHRSGELYATCFCRKQPLTLGGLFLGRLTRILRLRT